MNQQKKCLLKKHSEIDAIFYCQECNIYMCNKCLNYHSELFENHNKYELGKENINTYFCKEESHRAELKFYCKNHNKLCCTACISRIKGEDYGQHTDCEVCLIEKISDEKINKLKDNIKYLEDISLIIEDSMNELKKIIIKTDERKEELKIQVSKIFTKIRSALNEREDQLLLEIDNKFNEFIFGEKLIKQSEKIPNKIKEFLERGKKIENDWKNNDKRLNIVINDCIDIENNIEDIKLIQQNIEKYNSKNFIVNFEPQDEEEINKIINNIKGFGSIIKEEIEKLYINNLNSLIINDNKKYNKILKSWINENKIIEAELLYRLSRDGEKISKFHELCDNKGPTLTLFRITDGNIGGIYTSLSWDTVSEKKYDKETFMFNLNKEEKYKNKDNHISIWCSKESGPWTSYFGFIETMKKIEHRGISINKSYERGSEILPNDSEDKKFFDVLEVEVYKILIKKDS